MTVAVPKRVLITGAAGNLGQKLCRHLEQRGGYELIALDLKNAPDGIVGADLSVASESWRHLFAGVDCVVHLAAQTSSAASWQSVLMNNVLSPPSMCSTLPCCTVSAASCLPVRCKQWTATKVRRIALRRRCRQNRAKICMRFPRSLEKSWRARMQSGTRCRPSACALDRSGAVKLARELGLIPFDRSTVGSARLTFVRYASRPSTPTVSTSRYSM